MTDNEAIIAAYGDVGIKVIGFPRGFIFPPGYSLYSQFDKSFPMGKLTTLRKDKTKKEVHIVFLEDFEVDCDWEEVLFNDKKEIQETLPFNDYPN